MKVLLALEVHSGENAAVSAAAARPWPVGTSFCLLHSNVPLTSPMLVPRLFSTPKTALLQKLDHAAAPLRRAGWNVRTEVVEGNPRRTINEFAKEWKADLVMVGAHEQSAIGRLCLGSTAQAVMRHAPCSVEIVRPRPTGNDGGWKILVATDGSEFSQAALHAVASGAWPPGSQVKVISVPEFILGKDASYLEKHPVRDLSDLGAASIEDAKKCLSEARLILGNGPFPLIAEIPEYEERPFQVILHEAERWGADLIVVGSHGRSGFDRFVMGSVSEAVALRAQCSVEVVRDTTIMAQHTSS